jgi:hypothetical protein
MTPFALGRVQEHDPQSRGFAAPTALPISSVWWRRYGLVLDQGQLGSCTGNAAAQALNHLPFHVIGSPCLGESTAVSLYSVATNVDAFDGTYPPEDTGSSGLAVAKAAQLAGYITSYEHAFGLDHVLAAAQYGPQIIGTDWHEEMFYPDADGTIVPSGPIAGGHEYVLDGVDLPHRRLRFLNSWGSGWGARGRFYMSFDNFATLLDAGGDAVLFRK